MSHSKLYFLFPSLALGSIVGGGGGPSSELGKRKNRWGEDDNGSDAPAAPGCKI
jgi:hypothetical protein